ncbi:MAG TPA: TetR/AcrR family transcriptional regulator [Acidimicrobiia bacterium]|nr:TetR/AcrR family transcriptional regulator [Acidimicrobiia bacterium]
MGAPLPHGRGDVVAGPPAARRRPGRPRTADDAAIAGAVLQALVERGYDGMTVDHVARLAGVGRATLYRRWPTKTAMVIEALGRGRFPVPDDPDTGDPRADFLELLRTVQATFEREHHVIRALQLEAARHPDIGVALRRDFIAQRLDVLTEVLRRAAAAGLLRAPDDLELLARVGPALIWQHCALLTNEPDPDLPGRITDLVFADPPRPRRSKR